MRRIYAVEIPSYWRIISLITNLLGTCSSFVWTMSLGNAFRNLDTYCPFFSLCRYTINGSSLHVDNQLSEWTNVKVCNYVLFSGAASFCYSFITCGFFVVCRRSNVHHSNILNHPDRLVIPAFIISFIFSIISFFATWIIVRGYQVFCVQLISAKLPGCQQARQFQWWYQNNDYMRIPFHFAKADDFLIISHVSVILTTCCWILSTITLLVRFFSAVDFKEISSSGNKKNGKSSSGIEFSQTSSSIYESASLSEDEDAKKYQAIDN